MSKHSLPESLELLLDTMCNTFGGVMFIAISMVITLMICQQQLIPEKQLELEKERLEACKKENQSLNGRYRQEQRHLEQIKKLVDPNAGDRDSGIAEIVVQLEQNIRDLNRQLETLNSEIKIVEEQNKRLSQKNAQREQENNQKQQELEKLKRELASDNQRLSYELSSLRETLQNTPARKINFAMNEKTSRIPYIAIIEDDKFFPAGTPPLKSSNYATVTQKWRFLQISPQKGIPLSSINAGNFLQRCPGFSNNSHFLWVLVHDNSLASFVKFRRMVRALNCQLKWNTSLRYVFFLNDNVEYSSAK